MAKYTFTCSHGSTEVTAPMGRDFTPPECPKGDVMKRDYRADAPQMSIADLKRDREGSRDLILPTARELAGPGDPDGSKGIREWNERFEPAPGNKHPKRPKA